MISNIEITGTTGFVGQNLIDYLYNDFAIESLKLRYLPNQKILLQSQAVIHLAGKAHDLKKTSDPKSYYEANFELTKQLFDSFLQSESKIFIYVSSVKAVADETEKILTEDCIPNPQTDYGKSKLMAEQYLFFKAFPANKYVYILRPCMIHGRGNKGNLNLLFEMVNRGIPYPLSSFENKRSLLSIHNLCFIIKELLVQNDVPCGIYNVADDTPISTNRIIELMASEISKKAITLKINKKLIKALAKLGDIINLPLNTERLMKLTENYIVDNSKIKNILGKNLPLSTENGLRITLKYFKHEKIGSE